MSDYDPNTTTVYAGQGLYVVCSLCDEPFFQGEHTATMAELDTACQRHWREVHAYEHVVPM